MSGHDFLLDAVRHVLELGPEDPVPAALKVEQAAKLLRISRGLAYEGVREGDIPSIKVGRRLVVPTARLLALLDGDQSHVVDDGGREEEPVGQPSTLAHRLRSPEEGS